MQVLATSLVRDARNVRVLLLESLLALDVLDMLRVAVLLLGAVVGLGPVLMGTPVRPSLLSSASKVPSSCGWHAHVTPVS